jgi:putative tryptophan/tyrosine transport system substrate-binding protein
LAAKRLGLLHDLIPKSVTIAALFHPGAPGADLHMEEVEKASQTIGRQVLIVKVTDERDSMPRLRRWSNKAPAGCSSAAVHISSADVDNSPRWRLATSYAEAGVLMSYGSSQADAYRRAGIYVADIPSCTAHVCFRG